MCSLLIANYTPIDPRSQLHDWSKQMKRKKRKGKRNHITHISARCHQTLEWSSKMWIMRLGSKLNAEFRVQLAVRTKTDPRWRLGEQGPLSDVSTGLGHGMPRFVSPGERTSKKREKTGGAPPTQSSVSVPRRRESGEFRGVSAVTRGINTPHCRLLGDALSRESIKT